MEASLFSKVAASDASRRLVMAWFALDALIALAPPFYWLADGCTSPILGVPGALAYFLAVDICITASIVVAWLADRSVQEDRT